MAQELNPSDAGAWSQWVTNFDSSFRSFMADWQNLSSPEVTDFVYNQHPELIASYQDLLSRGQTNLSSLQALKATRDYVASWLNWLTSGIQSGVDFVETGAQSAYDAAKAVLGLSGYRGSRGNLNGLGVVPIVVIGLAAAAAALVVVGIWVNDYLKFAERYNALKDQEELFKRLNPQASDQEIANAATSAVEGTMGPAPGAGGRDSILGIPWSYVIAGAVAVFLGPPLIEMVSKKGAHA